MRVCGFHESGHYPCDEVISNREEFCKTHKIVELENEIIELEAELMSAFTEIRNLKARLSE